MAVPTTYSLKINAAGSWANVLRCRPEQLPAVRDACEILVGAAESRIKFKLLDADGIEVEQIDSTRTGWRPAPRRNGGLPRC